MVMPLKVFCFCYAIQALMIMKLEKKESILKKMVSIPIFFNNLFNIFRLVTAYFNTLLYIRNWKVSDILSSNIFPASLHLHLDLYTTALSIHIIYTFTLVSNYLDNMNKIIVLKILSTFCTYV
jgi:hypothetical protein